MISHFHPLTSPEHESFFPPKAPLETCLSAYMSLRPEGVIRCCQWNAHIYNSAYNYYINSRSEKEKKNSPWMNYWTVPFSRICGWWDNACVKHEDLKERVTCIKHELVLVCNIVLAASCVAKMRKDAFLCWLSDCSWCKECLESEAEWGTLLILFRKSSALHAETMLEM